MQTLQPVHVFGDVFTAAAITGPYIISGTLHIPPGVLLGAEVLPTSTVREPVLVPPPCPCLGPPLLDVGAAVTERSARNANAELPFADAFQHPDRRQPELRLSVRRVLFLRHSNRRPGLAGVPHSRADRRSSSMATCTWATASASRWTRGRSWTWSSPDRWSATAACSVRRRRRRACGSGSDPTTVSLPDQVQLGAVVYAPLAVLSVGLGATISGSLFVGQLTVGINGDAPAVLRSGRGAGRPELRDPASAPGGVSARRGRRRRRALTARGAGGALVA